MNSRPDPTPPPFPDSLRAKLVAYRRTLWTTKGAEALLAALFGLVLSFVVVFALDRWIDTPTWARLFLLVAGSIGAAVYLPVQLVRWVGRHRSLKALASRVARQDLATGDALLGVLELCHDRREYQRSPQLVAAAIAQGEASLQGRDLAHTLPRSRHRAWAGGAGAVLVAAGLCFVATPAGAANALARWLLPTADIERFTFARLAPHEDHLVVARYEPFLLELELDPATQREPARADLYLAEGLALEAHLEDGGYAFEVPALGQETTGFLIVGDFREELSIEPVDRPEIREAVARVTLPDYLELADPDPRDVRGGNLSVVEESRVSVRATLTRELSEVHWSAGDARHLGAEIETAGVDLSETLETELEWRDIHGLSGPVPFRLGLRTFADAPPTVHIEGLEPESILLLDKAMSFSVRAGDDFGVRQVGLEWRGYGDEDAGPSGEKPLGQGAPDARSLELDASLHPRLEGIGPQRLRLFAYALDALPGRERAYSSPIHVWVMTAEEHMIWVTRALGEWFDEAVEVRDTEHQLLQNNEQLLARSDAELATAEARRELQNQAAAERANARRLEGLVSTGDRLLAEAARNEEINSNTMDDWAEMMAALDEIAARRMPSVAEHLAQAAEAQRGRGSSLAEASEATSPGSERSRTASEGDASEGEANEGQPRAGQPGEGPAGEGESSDEPLLAGNRREGQAAGDGETPPASPFPTPPSVVDQESSFADADAGEGESPPPPEGSGSPGRLTLPTTTVPGGPAPPPSETPPAPAAAEPTREELAQAVAEQRALMEEFQRVAGEINEILANLEGSTFVKRLKALARAEGDVARDLDRDLELAFGRDELADELKPTGDAVRRRQDEAAERAALVRQDLAAYTDRLVAQGRDAAKFQTVQREMGEVGVTREMAAIRDLAGVSRHGEAIAGAENLADELDRWAEILVGPG